MQVNERVPAPRRASRPRLSVVIPVFNEEGNLAELHARLTQAVGPITQGRYEIIFVNDGSRDRTPELLEELFAGDPHVRVLSFTRNFGHHIALTAGLDAADGERVVLMDADLQDQPEEIPVLWRKMDEGYDVVFGIRQNRKDGLFKRVTSAIFVAIMNRIIGARVSLTSGVFRMVTQRVAQQLRVLREQHRFVIGLITWLGYRETGVAVEHAARFHGETKYSLWKMIKLALNTITAFSQVPLRITSFLGLIISLASFTGAVAIIVRKVGWDIPIEGWPSLFVLTAFLGGVQLVMLGIIGEYLGRVYAETLNRPLYVLERELRHEAAVQQATASPPV
jgi:polyisoprenyl-phosphate glycosyltransferase